MSLVALVQKTTLRRAFSLRLTTGATRGYSSKPSTSQPASESTKSALSSCPPGTVMIGLNYLKGEAPVLAKPDEEYPAWLWDLTKPKHGLAEDADDGPGGKVEKRRLRMQHRQALKDSNLFKSN